MYSIKMHWERKEIHWFVLTCFFNFVLLADVSSDPFPVACWVCLLKISHSICRGSTAPTPKYVWCFFKETFQNLPKTSLGQSSLIYTPAHSLAVTYFSMQKQICEFHGTTRWKEALSDGGCYSYSKLQSKTKIKWKFEEISGFFQRAKTVV